MDNRGCACSKGRHDRWSAWGGQARELGGEVGVVLSRPGCVRAKWRWLVVCGWRCGKGRVQHRRFTAPTEEFEKRGAEIGASRFVAALAGEREKDAKLADGVSRNEGAWWRGEMVITAM